MQFKSVFYLALLCGITIASHAEKRDPKPIIDALGSISKSIQGMTTAVSAFAGDPAEGAKILTQAEDLLAIIAKETKNIDPTPALPLNEAVQILQPGNALINDTQKVIDALIGKKPSFDKNNLSVVVGETLTKFKDGAAGLVKAITTKLPSNVASVGNTIAKQINAALDKGIAAYK